MDDIKDLHDECGCGHDHHDDECGCGHDHDVQYMTLTTTDGEEMKCAVIGIFDLEEIEGKEYIALVPQDSDEVLLYQYIEAEDGEGFELANIESDGEFDTVEAAFMEMIDGEYDDDEYDDDEEYEYEELDDEDIDE